MGPDSLPRVVVTAPGTVRVGLKSDGSYRIEVTPLHEKIKKTDTSRLESACVSLASPPANSDTQTYDPFVFDIIGTLPDPNNRRELKGAQTVMMTSLSTDRSMGIEQYGDPSGINGTPLPWKVKTTWDLKRLP